MPQVFISYSHDSEEHRARVLGLADRLNTEGVDCQIDQYLNGSPAEGWPLWMERMLEAAEQVLVVCTETYLRRVQRREAPGTGRDVKWESLLTYQQIYDDDSLNRKFIPVVFDAADRQHIPKPLHAATAYDLSHDAGYLALYRCLTDQPRAVKPQSRGRLDLPPENQPKLSSGKGTLRIDQLPTVPGDFFGRTQELQLLDAALAGDGTRIIQFVASGGTGKTKLLRHWLNRHLDGMADYLIWSFYSQGSAEDKQVSASPLFSAAFEALGIDPAGFKTEEARADALAEQLIQRRCLLVLDGLEPLQHAGRGLDGRLKDRALAHLLKRLAQQHTGLCLVTTRIRVHDLSDRAHVVSHPLDNLSTEDGVRLLRSFGISGPAGEMTRAVEEVEGHALTLHLLGNAVGTYLDGDIRKRDTLPELIDDYDPQGRHAFKVMQAYDGWLRDGEGRPLPELQLLYLLGLFDHPVETGVLEVLWREGIPGLTDGIPERAWKAAIRNLRDRHHLLFRHPQRPGLLDCHPLIREWFGRQLQTRQPEAWQQAHERLYDHYRTLPEQERPDTLAGMQPLFSAVAHGCAAGLHQRALEEVYWPRVKRKDEHYLTRKLGAFSDDLACVAHFFTAPWRTPAAGLGKIWKGGVLNWAGFRLRALGRLREALEPMQASVEMAASQKSWVDAAKGSGNLSELQLTLGDLAQAVQSGRDSVAYADRSGDMFQRMSKRTTHANALHQAGDPEAALALFREAEGLQQERQPDYPRLYSLRGFRYCDLLLARGGGLEVLERAGYALQIVMNGSQILLDIALNQLALARAHLQQALAPGPGPGGPSRDPLPQAAHWLDQAVAGLRTAGQQDYLPHGLVTRATLHRHTGAFPLAHRDLQEVQDLAEPAGMRLHLTDYTWSWRACCWPRANPARRTNTPTRPGN